MRYEITEEEFERIEAATLSEFARALLLGLGAVLLVSMGTYLAFAGLAATLMALVS